jgi:signal peptidase II
MANYCYICVRFLWRIIRLARVGGRRSIHPAGTAAAKQSILKYRNALILIFLIIMADQALKIYIKTHFINGDEVRMMGNWFKLHFIENEGMAYGMKLGFAGASIGKLLLTSFRLIAVVFGFFFLKKLTDRKYPYGLVLCGALILAGALGNLLDSMFYGLVFSDSPASCYAGFYDNFAAMFSGREQASVAHFTAWGQGYGHFMQGRVVDMLYFPVVEVREMPHWLPLFGGKPFVFFEPVFNIADAAISVGVMLLLGRLYFVKDGRAMLQTENATES